MMGCRRVQRFCGALRIFVVPSDERAHAAAAAAAGGGCPTAAPLHGMRGDLYHGISGSGSGGLEALLMLREPCLIRAQSMAPDHLSLGTGPEGLERRTSFCDGPC